MAAYEHPVPQCDDVTVRRTKFNHVFQNIEVFYSEKFFFKKQTNRIGVDISSFVTAHLTALRGLGCP
jgi:hypothetical protein